MTDIEALIDQIARDRWTLANTPANEFSPSREFYEERIASYTEEVKRLTATCRVCGGYGVIAQKQFIDDGYGEVESCPSCSV